MSKIIHTKKLFGGRETAEEVHRKYAWGPEKRCALCPDVPVIRISLGCSPKDLIENMPNLARAVMAQSDRGGIPYFESKHGPMTWFNEVFACDTHRAIAEKQAARGPSWVLVEIDRGPGKDKTVVQVPGLREAG